MNDIEKTADLFEKTVLEGDVFGDVSYNKEAEHLRLIAGKLGYKAGKETDRIKSERLKEISKMILAACDMLKRL